jgi:hypothetical protein
VDAFNIALSKFSLSNRDCPLRYTRNYYLSTVALNHAYPCNSCGGNVGIFLAIRKCCILYLHHESGSWTVAPYLDKYGEVDPSLRSNMQLFLNQKRYDAIFRTAWLQHQIPSVIARKLEGEINTGGWESL